MYAWGALEKNVLWVPNESYYTYIVFTHIGLVGKSLYMHMLMIHAHADADVYVVRTSFRTCNPVIARVFTFYMDTVL